MLKHDYKSFFNSKENLKNTLTILLLFIASITLLNFFYRTINFDEGVILNGAWKMYNGQILYRDFFEYVAPGSYYLVWAIFKIFSPLYFYAHIFSLIFMAVACYFLYLSFLLIKKNRLLAAASALIWFLLMSIVPLINHNTYSVLIVITFLFLFLKFIDTKKNLYVFLAGIVTVFVIYFLQTRGLAVFLATIGFFIIFYNSYKRHILSYLAGIFLTAVIAWFIWGDYIYRNLQKISGTYQEMNTYLLNRDKLIDIFVILICFFAYKQYAKNHKIVFLIILQISLLLSILNLPDYCHLVSISFSAIILFIILVRDYLETSNRKYWWGYGFCLLLMALSFMTFHSKGFPFYSGANKFLGELKELSANKKVYIRPFNAGLYFELQKESPYYSDGLEIERNQEVLERNYQMFLEQKPDLVITNYASVRKLNYKYNKIDDYIADNYKQTKQFGSLIFWEIIN